MGATSSKTSVDVINEIMVQAYQNNSSRCTQTSTQQQSLNLGTVSGKVDISIQQTMDVDLSCIMSSSMQTTINNEIANKIVQKAEAESVAAMSLVSAATRSEAVTKIANMFSSSVTNVSLQESVQATLQRQTANIGTVTETGVLKLKLGQGMKMVAEAVIANSQISEVVNKLATTIDQAVASKQTNPLDFLTGPLMWIALAVIGAVVLVIVMVVAM